MTTNKKPWKFHLAVLGGYFLLAMLLTWPTVAHFSAHLPGDGGDDPSTAWNLWQIKYSLLNQPQNPLFSNSIFYPIGVNLAFYTLGVLNGLAALPLLLNFGVVAASNLHLWFSFALSGYGVFLLTRYLSREGEIGRGGDREGGRLADEGLFVTPSPPHPLTPSFVAGLIYAFASSKLFYASLGQFTIASTHWIPFAVLFFIKMHHDPHNWRWPALSALFLVMQTWTEMIYASFLLIFMAFYWIYDFGFTIYANLAHNRQSKIVNRQLSILLMAIIFLIGISPLLAAMLPDMLAEGDFLVVGGGFADAFSADLAGFFIPTMRHPLFGELVTQSSIAHYDKGQHIYLGYTLLALAGLGFWANRRRKMAWFWLLASLTFAWLSLGPEIIINGYNTHLPGPFVILQQLPFFKGNRYPSRYSVMLLLSLSPLAAMGVKRAGGQVSRWAGGLFAHPPTRIPAHLLAALIAGLFLFEHLSVPLPQSDMTVPEAYQIIAQDDEDFAVLDIPFAWRNGFRITGAYTTGFMFGQFYQTGHQKPMLQGNTSRNPEFKFQYFTDAPVLSSLRILETGHALPPEQWEADRAIAADALRFFNIKYIVVRPEEPGYLNDPAATIPYIETILPVEKLHQDSTLTLYRVKLPPLPDQVDLLTNSPLTPLYFGEGWGVPGETVVAQRKEARLLVPLKGKAQTLHFTARLWPNDERQSGEMWFTMKGWKSAPLRLTQEWQYLSLDIPAEAVVAGLNDIRLHFDETSAISYGARELTVLSAGEEAGNFGHIYLNGREVSPNQRGYNIAVVALDGRLLDAANFDTHLDPEASRALTAFIAAAPDDAFIAVAAADEASNLLTEEAVAALRSIGGEVDLRGQFRASHALIGGKDAQQVYEAFDPFQPVKVTNGAGLVESKVGAVFREIRFDSGFR